MGAQTGHIELDRTVDSIIVGNRHRTDWLLAGPEALKPACRGLSPQIAPYSYTPGP